MSRLLGHRPSPAMVVALLALFMVAGSPAQAARKDSGVVDASKRVAGFTASQLLGASHPEMGQAALAMIDTWEFTPPKKKDGSPCFAAHQIAVRGQAGCHEHLAEVDLVAVVDLDEVAR